MNLSFVLLSIALAMDAFAISVAIGLQSSSDVSINKGVRSSAFFGFFQGLMIFIGGTFGYFISGITHGMGHYIAFLMLAAISIKLFYEGRNTQEVDENILRSLKMLVVFSIATSIDAFVAGASFGFLTQNLIFLSILVMTTTLGISMMGFILGIKFKNIGLIESYACYLGAIILGALAISMLF